MSARSPSVAYLEGFRDSLPFLIVIVPFGAIFGALAAEAGWDTAPIMGMSALVIAGAAQFTALQLLQEGAPVAVVIATALAVNLRMAMYSASMAPHLGAARPWERAVVAYALFDQTYATAIRRYTLDPPLGGREKVFYFFGAMTPVCLPWYAATWAGAVAGAAIPEALALDFAVPVTFIALVAPGLRSAPHLAATVVSVVVALGLAGLPYSLGLLVAAPLAMLSGAAVETARRPA